MRRTRKNKGGTTNTQVGCYGLKIAGKTVFLLPAFVYGLGMFAYQMMDESGSGFGSGVQVSSTGTTTGTTKESFFDCNSLRKKVYQSLKEINLAKKS